MSELSIRMGGGFGDAALSEMSPRLRARVQAADAEYAREVAKEERERAFLRDEEREAAIAASVIQAADRGEVFDLQEALQRGIGRTPNEVIEYASAMADIQDMRVAAEKRKLFNEFEAGFSADMSAPTPAEVAEKEAERAHHAEWGPKVAEERARRRETRRMIRANDRLKQMGLGGV
jgi:hypothetical protein